LIRRLGQGRRAVENTQARAIGVEAQTEEITPFHEGPYEGCHSRQQQALQDELHSDLEVGVFRLQAPINAIEEDLDPGPLRRVSQRDLADLDAEH